MNVAIYARISLDRDGTAEAINRRQVPDCTAYARTHSHVIVDTLTDNDISASKSKNRPSYNRLFSLVRSGAIKGVVVYHLDRLYRSPRELEDLIDQVEATGLRIYTTSGGDFDLNTSDGRAYARIIVALACKESEDKSRRIKRKAQETAERGLPHSGMGYGYNQDLTINEDQALVIKQSAHAILSGATLYSATKSLNDRGIPSPKGKAWSPLGLKKVLTSGRIAGIRETNTHSKTPTLASPAAWPAIITEDELTILRSILLSRTRAPYSRSFLLAGMLRCSYCGATLKAYAQSQRGRMERRYYCHKVRGGCGHLGIQASKAEAFVADLVLHRLRDVKPRRKDVDLARKVRADEDRLANLAQKRFVDEKISDLEYEAARQPIVDRLELNRNKLHSQTTMPIDVSGVTQTWPSLSFDQQRAVLFRVIDHITVAPAQPGRLFDGARLSDVVWKV